jgi:hypothetical protein
MHSRILLNGVIATFGVTVVCWPKPAITAEWFEGQEILVECPNWHWETSQIPDVVYELCFDDIEQCTAADIGDPVCTPGLGVHDVWVTAIDYRGADPVYYDGEVVSIIRVRSADFNGNGAVEFGDLFALIDVFGVTGDRSEDLDGDGAVSFEDFMLVMDAFGKCVSETGQLYAVC